MWRNATSRSCIRYRQSARVLAWHGSGSKSAEIWKLVSTALIAIKPEAQLPERRMILNPTKRSKRLLEIFHASRCACLSIISYDSAVG
jgi:hypothetical protein